MFATTYTTEEVTRGLLAVAYMNGNTRKASAFLKGDGLKIPAKTLWNWSNKSQVAEYERVRADLLPQVAQKAAERHRSLAELAIDLEEEAIDKLSKRVKTGEVDDRDLTNIAKNSAIQTGIHTEKSQLLEGRPTHRVERSATDVLRALKARGFDFDGSVAGEEDIEPPALPA